MRRYKTALLYSTGAQDARDFVRWQGGRRCPDFREPVEVGSRSQRIENPLEHVALPFLRSRLFGCEGPKECLLFRRYGCVVLRERRSWLSEAPLFPAGALREQ